MTTTTTTDRYGFPVQTCSRCEGTGRFSHNGEHDRCYGCNGAGVQYPKAVKPVAAEFQAALKALRTPTLSEIVPGDVIRRYGTREAFRTVETIERTDHASAWQTNAAGERTNVSWVYAVTFTDSTHVELAGMMQRTNVTLDAAPYLARLPKSRR